MARWRQPGREKMLQTFLLLNVVAFLLASCRARTLSRPHKPVTAYRRQARHGTGSAYGLDNSGTSVEPMLSRTSTSHGKTQGACPSRWHSRRSRSSGPTFSVRALLVRSRSAVSHSPGPAER
jgi:hypothetical protein